MSATPAGRQYLSAVPNLIGHTMSDTIISPVITGAVTMTYRDPIWEEGFTRYLDNNDPYAVTIWEEAHAEHAERFPVRSRAEEPDTYVWMVDIAWDLAHAERDLRNLRAEVGRLSARVTELRTEQINGSDPRLTSFWERAAELADEAGHCEIYDELAEALGGEARRKDYDVTVIYRYSVSLSKAEADDFDIRDYDPADYDDAPDIRIERS